MPISASGHFGDSAAKPGDLMAVPLVLGEELEGYRHLLGASVSDAELVLDGSRSVEARGQNIDHGHSPSFCCFALSRATTRFSISSSRLTSSLAAARYALAFAV